jgi:hypothetical protein
VIIGAELRNAVDDRLAELWEISGSADGPAAEHRIGVPEHLKVEFFGESLHAGEDSEGAEACF